MVERACDEGGQSGFVYATRRFYAQAPQLSARANFDLAGADPGFKTGLRERNGSVDNATVLHRKARAGHGHFTLSSSNSPSESGPPRCEQVSASAKILSPRFTKHIARHGLPHSAIRQLLSAITGRNFDGNF